MLLDILKYRSSQLFQNPRIPEKKKMNDPNLYDPTTPPLDANGEYVYFFV
jgi:hypothetical protein